MDISGINTPSRLGTGDRALAIFPTSMPDEGTTSEERPGCERCGTADRPMDGQDEQGGNKQGEGGASRAQRWNPEAPILEQELPEELQTALGRLLGRDRITTLDAWVAEITDHTDGDPISIDDLCVVDEPTDHWGSTDGTRYYFRCFYDAVILAALTDEPVEVRTKSPDGAIIEASALGTDRLTVSPPDAVFSFGVETGTEPPGPDGPSHAAIYEANCPYVRAFPDRDAYERWAATIPASTIVMTPEGAMKMAAKITG